MIPDHARTITVRERRRTLPRQERPSGKQDPDGSGRPGGRSNQEDSRRSMHTGLTVTGLIRPPSLAVVFTTDKFDVLSGPRSNRYG